MFDVGGGELLLIFLAILVLFGPKKIPELARSFGKGLAQFRKAQAEFQRNLHSLEDEITTSVNEVVQDVQRHVEQPIEQSAKDSTGQPLQQLDSNTYTDMAERLPQAMSNEGMDNKEIATGAVSTRVLAEYDNQHVTVQPLTSIRFEPAPGTVPVSPVATTHVQPQPSSRTSPSADTSSSDSSDTTP